MSSIQVILNTSCLKLHVVNKSEVSIRRLWSPEAENQDILNLHLYFIQINWFICGLNTYQSMYMLRNIYGTIFCYATPFT